MLIVGFFNWWYGAGFKKRIELFLTRLRKMSDFFSLKLLITTLFAPFRMIDSQPAKGSLDVRIKDWFGRLFSRIIGVVIRLVVLIIGSVELMLEIVIGLLMVIMWLILPLLPIACLVMLALGVSLPWTI